MENDTRSVGAITDMGLGKVDGLMFVKPIEVDSVRHARHNRPTRTPRERTSACVRLPAGSGSVTALELSWTAPDDPTFDTHANEKDAIEAGAYGIAFAVAVNAGLVVRRRAHQGSGADYLVTREGEPDNDFIRVEVRGIARAVYRLEPALDKKVAQLGQGDLDRPGIAMVVGFEHARVLTREVPR